MKRASCATLGFAVTVFAACALATGADTPAAGGEGIRSSRELFRLFDMDEAFFASFVDDRPLGDDELDKAVRLLFRLRHIESQVAERWVKGVGQWTASFGDVAGHRGEMYELAGQVVYVREYKLPSKLVERADANRLYLCRMIVFGGPPAVVLAASVPAAWPRGKPMREPARVRGVLLKNSSAEKIEGTKADWGSTPLMLADRVAWHPDTLLGSLGMDVGLLDQVRDRQKLIDDDREPFYQLLAAVGRAKTDQLEAAAARLAGPEAQRGASDVEPLFNRPEQQRGRLVTLEGAALRVVEIRVDDPDLVARSGIRHYYEIQFVTGDSQNNPLTACVRELPAGMPIGQEIHERVRVAGFFFKTWAYHSRHASAQHADSEARPQQLSPLIVAKTLRWTPTATGLHDVVSATVAIGLGILAACGMGLLIWKFTRGDRQARRQLAARFELPEGTSLDRLAP